jgi:hypothetical protein
MGSLPHREPAAGVDLVIKHTPEIPAWPQFPRLSKQENMIIQFTEGMPALTWTDDKLHFDTALDDYAEQLANFYGRYLAFEESNDSQDLESFRLSNEYAIGFSRFMQQTEALEGATMLKGQVTGPFTFGTNMLDQDRRCAYYDDQLRDVIVKTVALKSIWQLRQLARFGKPMMIFIDEPSLLSYGSQTFITVSKEDIITDLNEVARAIHNEGGWVGVHCEADTDWTILMEADLDVLVFDAYDHMQGMTLYPQELSEYLDDGGSLGWGIVPTLDKEAAATETVDGLIDRFNAGLKKMEEKGLSRDLLLERAFLTPSCGAGGILDEPLAERVFSLLAELSERLRSEHGFTNR